MVSSSTVDTTKFRKSFCVVWIKIQDLMAENIRFLQQAEFTKI